MAMHLADSVAALRSGKATVNGIRRSRVTRHALSFAVVLLVILAAATSLFWDLGVILGLSVVPRLTGGSQTIHGIAWFLYLGAPWTLVGLVAWLGISSVLASLPPRPICPARIAASSAPVRDAMTEPTLPKTAERQAVAEWHGARLGSRSGRE